MMSVMQLYIENMQAFVNKLDTFTADDIHLGTGVSVGDALNALSIFRNRCALFVDEFIKTLCHVELDSDIDNLIHTWSVDVHQRMWCSRNHV